MMASVVFTQEQLEALGYKLGTLDDQFTAEERALIHGILARGVAGVLEDAGEDVSGFTMLLPAVQKVRVPAARASADPPGGLGQWQVELGDGSVRPAESLSLNFTKINF